MDNPAGTASLFYEQVVALEREGTAFVLVVLAESLGSTPQDSGAKMLVTAAGLHTGTIGGGKVEAKALTVAQEMLTAGAAAPQFASWALKTDVGMTCGGSVKLYFEQIDHGNARRCYAQRQSYRLRYCANRVQISRGYSIASRASPRPGHLSASPAIFCTCRTNASRLS